jgi:hypothetical protein
MMPLTPEEREFIAAEERDKGRPLTKAEIEWLLGQAAFILGNGAWESPSMTRPGSS